MDEMLQFEKKTKEEKKRVYTYEKAVERYCDVPVYGTRIVMFICAGNQERFMEFLVEKDK